MADRERDSGRPSLYDFVLRPHFYRAHNSVFYEDAACCVVWDPFPKARYHLLLVPKPGVLPPRTEPTGGAREGASHGIIDGPDQLDPSHLPALRALHAVAEAVADRIRRLHQDPAVPDFWVGYHSVPSLRPLHLHIISSDLVSPFLTTRQHYLSFASSAFLRARAIEDALEEHGRVDIHRAAVEATLSHKAIRCHIDRRVFHSVPDLKNALESSLKEVLGGR